jgi:hypothetical protein
VSCGFADNADRVGGSNAALRSLLQRQAVGERAVCQSAYSDHEGDCSSESQTLNGVIDHALEILPA